VHQYDSHGLSLKILPATYSAKTKAARVSCCYKDASFDFTAFVKLSSFELQLPAFGPNRGFTVLLLVLGSPPGKRLAAWCQPAKRLHRNQALQKHLVKPEQV